MLSFEEDTKRQRIKNSNNIKQNTVLSFIKLHLLSFKKKLQTKIQHLVTFMLV